MTLEPTARPRGTANRVLVGLAVAGVAAADQRRSGMFVGASGVAVVGAYLAAMAAGSSWS
ncbi:MAG: hypothetical protein M3486_00670 [Actinomycetota bacterium]|nr:hypothetical protein [Actinomycetota bacterium]